MVTFFRAQQNPHFGLLPEIDKPPDWKMVRAKPPTPQQSLSVKKHDTAIWKELWALPPIAHHPFLAYLAHHD